MRVRREERSMGGDRCEGEGWRGVGGMKKGRVRVGKVNKVTNICSNYASSNITSINSIILQEYKSHCVFYFT